MNEIARNAASELLKGDPDFAKTFDDFLADQEEFIRMLDLMGLRYTAIELPPASNAEGTLHGNVSGVNR